MRMLNNKIVLNHFNSKKNLMWCSSDRFLYPTTEGAYIIDLLKYDISSSGKNATKTTIGINNAILYAKQNGYNKVVLPPGKYLINTSYLTKRNCLNASYNYNAKGIVMQSGITLFLYGVTLIGETNADNYSFLISFVGCENSKIVGGTIIGDKLTHDYGHRVNNNFNELEFGDIDDSTGALLTSNSNVRTINFISQFEDWITKEKINIPEKFAVIPLWNTSLSTTDGGNADIYCYDENENYIGKCADWGYEIKTLLASTKKIKVVIKKETRLDAVIAFSYKDLVYYNPEFPAGIMILSSNNISIMGCKVYNFCGDCIQTLAYNNNLTVDNLLLYDCTLEGSRRQGISFTSMGSHYLLKNCNIGKIQGTDPQAGIDFEDYGGINSVHNVLIDGCNFYETKKLDIINFSAHDIEVKNCHFTGGIGMTFGWNMYVHDNIFSYKDADWLKKSHVGWAIAPNDVDKGDSYVIITNNYFENYSTGNGVSNSFLVNSKFENNKINNCRVRINGNQKNNTYQNSNIEIVMTNKDFCDETIINSILSFSNNGTSENIRKSINLNLINTKIFPSGISKESLFENCKLYYDTSYLSNAYSGSYTFKNSTIETRYKTQKIPFLNPQQCTRATFDSCNMNLSCTPFMAVNYHKFEFINNIVTFNNSYESYNTITFLGGSSTCSNNRFYKNFLTPKIVLPISENSYYNDKSYTGNITI